MVRVVNDNCDRQPTDIWKSDRLLIHHLITSYRTLRREDRSVMERDIAGSLGRNFAVIIYSPWIIMSESSWKPWNCCFHRQRLLGNLEDSAILLYNFIPRYGRMIVERPVVRSETKRIALSVEYIQAVGISQFVKTCRKFQLHVLRWISSCVFSMKNTLVKSLARRWSQVQRGSRNQPKHFHGGFGFSLFLCGLTLRPLNKLRKSDWNWVQWVHLCNMYLVGSPIWWSEILLLELTFLYWKLSFHCQVWLLEGILRSSKFTVYCLPFHSLFWVVTPLVRCPYLALQPCPVPPGSMDKVHLATMMHAIWGRHLVVALCWNRVVRRIL